MRRLPVLSLLLLCLACAAAAPSARADVVWLCHPAMSEDPCRGDLTTTVTATDGSSRVEPVTAPAAPPVDCFYVYPTVSNQLTTNATKTADPEVKSIATYQAQRFSTRCRVFAPLYRQVTAAGVTMASQSHDATPYAVGYADVREAFAQYLAQDNGGRPFVLIGHSQGSRILRALLRADVDSQPAVRSRLLSAIIPGANANTADFANLPPCASGTQTGCVVSYSTFDETPPDNARFGRTDTDPVGTALDLPGGPVLCTDPAALTGTGGRLDSLVPTAPFAPGVISVLLLRLYGGVPPTAATPWVVPQDHYTGRCETVNGARVLMISPVGAARHLTPSPDTTWGTHLVDLNLPLGNLTALVGLQTQSWFAQRRALTVTLTHAKHRRLVLSLTGPPGRKVRATLLRGRGKRARTTVSRTFVLNASGSYEETVKLRRGSYTLVVRDVEGAGGTVRSKVLRVR